MNDLDKKLREIYDSIGDEFYWEGTLGKGDPDLEEGINDTINKIKQAFLEAGWMPIMNDSGEIINLMSGQLWYEKLVKELEYQEYFNEREIAYKMIIEAAKKASGLK